MGNDMDHQAGDSQLADCHTHPFVSSVCLWQSVHLLVRQRHSTDVSTEWLQCAGFVMPNSRLCWLPRRPHQCLEEMIRRVLRQVDRPRVSLVQVSPSLVLARSQPRCFEVSCWQRAPLSKSCHRNPACAG